MTWRGVVHTPGREVQKPEPLPERATIGDIMRTFRDLRNHGWEIILDGENTKIFAHISHQNVVIWIKEVP